MPDQNALLFWNRLLPEPEQEDVAEALRGEVRDALWLLARQWQLGELKGEDAATAAVAHVITHSTPLQQVMAPELAPTRLSPGQPLDATVERIEPQFDLSLRIEAGRAWRNMLTKAGKAEAWEAFRQLPDLQFQLPVLAFDPEDAELRAAFHEPYAQMLAACSQGRALDGGALYRALKKQKASALLAARDEAVDALGQQWQDWVRDHLGITPGAAGSCWDAARLEYRATAVAALPDGRPAFLQAPEHTGQPMEWHVWQSTGEQPELNKDLKAGLITTQRRTLVPTSVSFPGMPRARWWEMEDHTIDLSQVRANKTDTGLLLLLEFSLLFSNDWLLLPLALPSGGLSTVRSLRITDVFGVQSFLHSSPVAAADTGWGLFQLGSTDLQGWLWLPPLNSAQLQSEPVEEIMFLRDEMANMVWAVEKIVPDGLGGGMEGAGSALALEAWLRTLAGEVPAAPEALPDLGADFTYRIGNTVPPHWIPFLPFRPDAAKPELVLRRAAMPRIIAGREDATRIRPRSRVLRPGGTTSARYDLQEEEIPVMGLTVRTVWRRTRWIHGETVTWLAHEKMLGRHRESSGLQFDQMTRG